jgi:Glycosyltransferase family 87
MPDTRSPSRRFEALLAVLCVLLAGTSLMYWYKGLSYLVIHPEPPNDLRLRWVDERYVFAGENPYDVFFANRESDATRRPMWSQRPTSPLPGIGVPDNAGYPPWAFFAGAIFYWPGWPAVRPYFAVFNVLFGVLTFAWAYRVGRSFGSIAALTLALSCTACSANSTTLGVGQYSIVITGLLVGAIWLIDQRQRAGGGVMLGLALTKPITAGPYCLPSLFRGEWTTLIGLAGYLIVADAVIWPVTKTNPIEMVLQMLHAGQAYMSATSFGPLSILLSLGMPESKAVALAAISVLGIGAVLMWIWRQAAMLAQFAIASVVGRLWTYHRLYDNVMMLFLLVALGEMAIRSRKPLHVIMFLIVGLTLWAPGKACDHFAFQVFQDAAWTIGLGVLLAFTPRRATAA